MGMVEPLGLSILEEAGTALPSTLSSYQAGVVLWAGCGAQSTNPESGKEEQQLHGTSLSCSPLAPLSLLQPAGRDKRRKNEQGIYFFFGGNYFYYCKLNFLLPRT